MCTINEYIRKYYCSNDETEFVYNLLSNPSISNEIKLINNFFSFNMNTGEFYRHKNDEDFSIEEIEKEKRQPSEEYEKILKKYASSYTGYNKVIHNTLCELSIEIDKKNQEPKPLLIPFKDMVKWTRLEYNKFYEILVRLKFPVCIHNDKIWWGEISTANEIFIPIYKLLNTYTLDLNCSKEDNFHKILSFLEADFWPNNAINNSEMSNVNDGSSDEFNLTDSLKNLKEYWDLISDKDLRARNRNKINDAIKHPEKFKNYY
jgi:hypothetical protein